MESFFIDAAILAQTSTAPTPNAPAAGVALGGLLLLGILAVFMLFGLACFAFWVWMLVDCCRREFNGDNDKLIWVLVLIFTGALGALIYLIAGRPSGRLPGRVPPLPTAPGPVRR